MPYSNNITASNGLRHFPMAHKFYDQDNNQIHLNTEVQVLRAGTFSDAMGEVTIDLSDLESMVLGFKEKVRRTDIALDAGHDTQGPAYGWVKNLYIVNGIELWATMEYNNEGKEVINDKQYRYLSAEFAFEYTDGETGNTHGTTLFGIALTNRPFVKEMQPLTFKEKNMPAPTNTDVAKMLTEMETMKTQLTEVNTKLSTSDANYKKLSEDFEAQVKKNMELVDKNKNIEKTKEFDEKLSKGVVCEAQRKAFMEDDMKSFIDNSQKVNLTPASTSTTDEGNKTDDAQDEVMSLAKAKMKDDTKLQLSEAIVSVLKEKPTLAKKYNELFN